MKRFGKEIVAGAFYGIAVTLAYFLVEFALLTLVPLITQPSTKLSDPFWHAMDLLLIGYVACGAAFGAVAGGLFGWIGPKWIGPKQITSKDRLFAATLLLPVVSSVNLLTHWPLSGGGVISIAVAMVLISSMAMSLRSVEWRAQLAFLTGPLAASALLIFPLWISQDWLPYRSNLFRLASITATLSGVMAISFLVRKLTVIRRVSMPYDYALGVIALLSVTYATGMAINPDSPKLPPRAVVASKQRPNIVLIVMDTVRADHASLYGYERDTTPFLRELAKQSTLYERAFAVSDFTLPTHASMFTGLYPRTHGAYFAPPNYPKGRPLSQGFTTIAEILHANGYRTAGIVANAGYLAPEMGFAQGFELYDSRIPVHAAIWTQTHYLRRSVRYLLNRFTSTADFEVRARRGDEINREAYHVLDQIDSPFFLFVNYMDAHSPYVPPSPFDERYPCPDPAIRSLNRAGRVSRAAEVLSGQRDLETEERACLTSAYDGGIAYVDSQIGELVESLRARGLFDNMLLIVTSDHGEALGRRKQIGHGGISVYQNEIGIPLLVKYPGFNSEARVDTNVSQVDLVPTVLAAASIPDPPGLQGVNLARLDRANARFLVSVSYPDPWLIRVNRQYDRTEHAILFEDKKLVEYTSNKKELFDLARDLNEEHNLYREGDKDVLSLSSMLDQWKRSVPLAVPADRGVTDRSTVEKLKSLGYAQ